jgi:hypothetical protein
MIIVLRSDLLNIINLAEIKIKWTNSNHEESWRMTFGFLFDHLNEKHLIFFMTIPLTALSKYKYNFL